jgi:hypothetical protein
MDTKNKTGKTVLSQASRAVLEGPPNNQLKEQL